MPVSAGCHVVTSESLRMEVAPAINVLRIMSLLDATIAFLVADQREFEHEDLGMEISRGAWAKAMAKQRNRMLFFQYIGTRTVPYACFVLLSNSFLRSSIFRANASIRCLAALLMTMKHYLLPQIMLAPSLF